MKSSEATPCVNARELIRFEKYLEDSNREIFEVDSEDWQKYW